MKLIVIDNFFKDLNKVYNHVKSIETFDSKNYHNDPGLDTSKIEWPGYRSQQLHGKDEWLLKQFGESFKEHLSGLIKGEFLLNMFSHLRLDKDNATDFIHVDLPHTYSMLVYLSPTNLQSGTNLYNNDEELINSVKFVQNRAVVFSSIYKHSAINNHGTNIENGRLTLNIFMDEKK